jgi:phospholipid transport system substrate-binding protein
MRSNSVNRIGLAGALLLTLVPVLAAQKIDSSTPQQLIETSSRALLENLDANRAAYRKDISGLYKVIDSEFLPHVDVPYAAQQVLGKHWRDATAEQKKRFTDALYQSLLQTYGKALLDFTSDQMKILPGQDNATATRSSVRTRIRTSNGTDVAVNYTLRKVNDEWKVWDVVIEGISYVKSFRDDFGTEIDQKGLEALLSRLEKGQLKGG